MAPDALPAVRAALATAVVGQPAAVSQILDAVRAWDEDSRAGVDRPLVLALIGPTGTGKTSTARLLTRSLLMAKRDGEEREGEVLLNGGDFADTGDALEGAEGSSAGGAISEGPGLLALQSRVRGAVAQTLYECHGIAVVVFDEAQKAVRKALGVLAPLMQREGAGLSVLEEGQSVATWVPSTRAIVIIVTDVGNDRIDKFLRRLARPQRQDGRAHARSGEELRRLLAAELQFALTEEWEGAGVNLGALVSAVVPFLPFNQSGVRALLAADLARISRPRAPPTGLYHRIVVRAPEQVAAALSDPCVSDAHYGTDPAHPGDATFGGVSFAASSALGGMGTCDGGAAGVGTGAGENGAEQQVEPGTCVSPPSARMPKCARLCLPNARSTGDHCASCELPATLVTTWGARGVLHQGTSPMQLLLSRVARASAAGSFGDDTGEVTRRTLLESELEAEYRLEGGHATAPEPIAQDGGSGEGHGRQPAGSCGDATSSAEQCSVPSEGVGADARGERPHLEFHTLRRRSLTFFLGRGFVCAQEGSPENAEASALDDTRHVRVMKVAVHCRAGAAPVFVIHRCTVSRILEKDGVPLPRGGDAPRVVEERCEERSRAAL